MSSWRARRFLGYLFGAALVLSACGSGSGSPTGPISLGLTDPFTGFGAPLAADGLLGAKTAIAEVNAAGGVMGRKLTLDPVDDKTDPADVLPAIQKLVTVDGDVAVVGDGFAIVGGKTVFDRSQVPVVAWGGDVAMDTAGSDPMLWRITPSDSLLGVAMADFAYSRGYRKAAFLELAAATGQQGLKDFINKAWLKLGGTVVSTQDLAQGQPSYRSEITKLIAANPDVIFAGVNDSGTGKVVWSELSQLGGLSIPVVGNDNTGTSDFLKAMAAGAGASYVLSKVQYCTSAVFAGQSLDYFTAAFQKANGSTVPQDTARYSYDAVNLIALAMQEEQSTQGPAIVKGIKKITDPSGFQVFNYADGLAALKAGKAIKYVGASGPVLYDNLHNVYGDFGAYTPTDLKGTSTLVLTMKASDLQALAS